MSDYIKIIVVIFSITLAIALTLWNKIVNWTQNTLFPWIQQNLSPKANQLIRNAFAVLDKIAVTLHNAVKEAWQTLRKLLLKVAISFEKEASTSGKWVKRWTAWLIKKLENGEIAPVKRTEEQVMNWDELPSDVRSNALRNGSNNYEVDFTNVRDREIQELLN